MNSIELLKGVYNAYLKPEPSRISEHLGNCLTLINQHSLLPQVLRLCDLSTSPLQKSAADTIRKWSDRVMELAGIQSGTGEDRNRAASLALLIQLISHASFELMHSHKDKWVALLLNIINRKTEDTTVLGLGFVALGQLISKASGWDQMRREVLKDAVYGAFMSALVNNLEESEVETVQPSLKALMLVLRANLKGRVPVERLLRVLLRILSDTHRVPGQTGLQIYEDAMRCVPLILDSASTWTALLEQTIVSMHRIMDHFYTGFDEEKALIATLLPKHLLSEAEGQETIILQVWSDFTSASSQVPLTLHRLITLAHFTQCLFSSALSFTVDIPVWEMLIVVAHLGLLDGTRASPSPLHGLSAADVMLAAPILHQCAHSILETMIRQFRSQLFPFVVQIGDIITLFMANSRNPTSAPSLATSEVQISLHKLLATLFEVFKAGAVGIAQQAIQLGIEDLRLDSGASSPFGSLPSPTSQKNTPSSSNSTDPASSSTASSSTAKQNPNKKKAEARALSDPRAHINAEALTATSGHNAAASSKSDALRISALNCLQTAIIHIGTLIGDESRALIDKAIIGLCITMHRHQNSLLWRKSTFEPAFINPEVRMGIYRVLHASAISTGRFQTPSLPYAIQYLTLGQNDSEAAVSFLCAQLLATLNNLIHPRVPLLPPSASAQQRTSQLSVTGILDHQAEQLLLQQHEERTLMLLQRTHQARRDRHGYDDDMEDGGRPTKKSVPPGFEPSELPHQVANPKSVTNSQSTNFLDSMARQNTPVSSNAMSTTVADLASPTEHTVLFKTDESVAKSTSNSNTTISSASMAVDVDIVDDDPDSEDDEM